MPNPSPLPRGASNRHARRDLAVIASVLVVLLGLLSLVVSQEPRWLTSVDVHLGRPLLDLTRAHPQLGRFWRDDATVQQPQVYRLLLLVGVMVLLVARRWWTAARVATVLVVSALLAPVAKLLLERPRPTWADPVTVIGGYSYPSGHATAAWVFAAVCVLVAQEVVRRTARRVLICSVPVGAAVLVSLDRVFLGVHYPSDVVAGALLGTAIAVAGWAIVRPVDSA